MKIGELFGRVEAATGDLKRKKFKPNRAQRAGLVLTSPVLVAALLSSCSHPATVSLPNINNVPNAAQLPQYSPTTQADYRAAFQAIADEEAVNVGDYSQVTTDLSKIRNPKIAAITTKVVNAFEAVDVLDTDGIVSYGPASVVLTIDGLRVVSVKKTARIGLNDILAEQAIIAANSSPTGPGDNPMVDAQKDLAYITDPGIRREAGREVARAPDPGAYKEIVNFTNKALGVIGDLRNAASVDDIILDNKGHAA